jgi:restriction endonuclease fold toxin 7 of polymorphic toxin system
MPRHLLVGVLIGLIASSGCAGPWLIVRNERGEGAHADPSKQFIPIEYDTYDIHEAVEPYADFLASTIRQHDGHLRLRLASAMASGANTGDREFLEEYLSWCEVTRGQRGDCLDAQDPNMPGLTVDGKRAIALRMAFSKALREAADVVHGIDPVKVEALMMAWFAFYLVTLVAPEPVTKVLDVLMTANLIAFLGWDGFHNVLQGYIDLRKDAAEAKDFLALHEAGLKYGRRLGGSMVRIVTAIITWGIGAAAGMGRPSTELPGGDAAAWNAQAQGFELAAVSGGSVTVNSSGAVTLTLAAVATGPGRCSNASEEQPCPDYPTCGAGVVYKGQDGEARVRAVEDIGEKEKLFINGRWRIPDGIKGKVLTEVKNVRQLALTRQIRYLLDYARLMKFRFELWVPRGARLSEPLDQLIKQGAIRLRRIP